MQRIVHHPILRQQACGQYAFPGHGAYHLWCALSHDESETTCHDTYLVPYTFYLLNLSKMFAFSDFLVCQYKILMCDRSK